MAKLPKHKRIKRPTVLIKRAQCIRNNIKKTVSPIYRKLKINNHCLAKALSQEKQEAQDLFSKNLELVAEVHELVRACNSRDQVISNVLQSSKTMLQMIVTMSGHLSNTIASCQKFFEDQNTHVRTSSSSSGKRESMQRLSTKSPARGVVKPMVSGHTITKPTINLSRINLNMQHLQNANLSIIDENSSISDQSLDLSAQEDQLPQRRSRRVTLNALESNDNDESLSIESNRRSMKRFSRRNSRRATISSRLSKRFSSNSQVIKSPRVSLQDVSQFMRNSQTVNLRSLSGSNNRSSLFENESPNNSSDQVNGSQSMDEDDQSPPENVSRSESESDFENSVNRKSLSRKSNKNLSNSLNHSSIDYSRPGPSWMPDDFGESDDSLLQQESARYHSVSKKSASKRKNLSELDNSGETSGRERHRSDKRSTKLSLSQGHPNSKSNSDSLDTDSDTDSDKVSPPALKTPGKFSFITQRHRGGIQTKDINTNRLNMNDDDDDDDEYTLLLNMQRQLNRGPERDYDINELLNSTELRPLLDMKMNINNQQEVNDIPEVTETVQITQKCPRNIGHQPKSNNLALNVDADLETGSNEEENTINNQTSVAIGLPRLSDDMSVCFNNIQSNLAPRGQATDNRVRSLSRKLSMHLVRDTDENQEGIRKKRKISKKVKTKDPASAKVIVTKIDNSNGRKNISNDRTSTQSSTYSTSFQTTRNEPISDSETSNASSTNQKASSTRPRRQKAPKNLKEPSAKRKMRRNP